MASPLSHAPPPSYTFQCRRAAPLLKGQTARLGGAAVWATPDQPQLFSMGCCTGQLQAHFSHLCRTLVKSGRKHQHPKSEAARVGRGTGPWTVTLVLIGQNSNAKVSLLRSRVGPSPAPDTAVPLKRSWVAAWAPLGLDRQVKWTSNQHSWKPFKRASVCQERRYFLTRQLQPPSSGRDTTLLTQTRLQRIKA